MSDFDKIAEGWLKVDVNKKPDVFEPSTDAEALEEQAKEWLNKPLVNPVTGTEIDPKIPDSSNLLGPEDSGVQTAGAVVGGLATGVVFPFEHKLVEALPESMGDFFVKSAKKHPLFFGAGMLTTSLLKGNPTALGVATKAPRFLLSFGKNAAKTANYATQAGGKLRLVKGISKVLGESAEAAKAAGITESALATAGTMTLADRDRWEIGIATGLTLGVPYIGKKLTDYIVKRTGSGIQHRNLRIARLKDNIQMMDDQQNYFASLSPEEQLPRMEKLFLQESTLQAQKLKTIIAKDVNLRSSIMHDKTWQLFDEIDNVLAEDIMSVHKNYIKKTGDLPLSTKSIVQKIDELQYTSEGRLIHSAEDPVNAMFNSLRSRLQKKSGGDLVEARLRLSDFLNVMRNDLGKKAHWGSEGGASVDAARKELYNTMNGVLETQHKTLADANKTFSSTLTEWQSFKNIIPSLKNPDGTLNKKVSKEFLDHFVDDINRTEYEQRLMNLLERGGLKTSDPKLTKALTLKLAANQNDVNQVLDFARINLALNTQKPAEVLWYFWVNPLQDRTSAAMQTFLKINPEAQKIARTVDDFKFSNSIVDVLNKKSTEIFNVANLAEVGGKGVFSPFAAGLRGASLAGQAIKNRVSAREIKKVLKDPENTIFIENFYSSLRSHAKNFKGGRLRHVLKFFDLSSKSGFVNSFTKIIASDLEKKKLQTEIDNFKMDYQNVETQMKKFGKNTIIKEVKE